MTAYAWSSFVKSFRLILCVIGIIISIYALYVEVKKVHDQNYVAMCDINSKMSCTKVLTSKYGTGFGFVEHILGKDSIFNVPNTVYGIVFYMIITLLGFFNGKSVAWLMVTLCFLSCVGCVYLAYILYFILRDFCLVCISTYVVNALLFAVNIFHLTQLSSVKTHHE